MITLTQSYHDSQAIIYLMLEKVHKEIVKLIHINELSGLVNFFLKRLRLNLGFYSLYKHWSVNINRSYYRTCLIPKNEPHWFLQIRQAWASVYHICCVLMNVNHKKKLSLKKIWPNHSIHMFYDLFMNFLKHQSGSCIVCQWRDSNV